MSTAAPRVAHLNDILVGTVGGAEPDPPVDALAGFDLVAQFSHNLLNLQVVRSLTEHGVATLGAYVPWGTTPLTPSLFAAIPHYLRGMLSAIPARLEVRLSQPFVAGLHWPVDVTGGVVTGSITEEARTVLQRTADIGWLLEVDLLTQRPGVSVAGGSATAGSGMPASVSATVAGATMGGGPPSLDDSSWDRFPLGTGQAITTAAVTLDVPAGLWRFGLVLDFAAAQASVTSDNSGVVEFLGSNAGEALLVQALAPLKAALGVRLSPVIAPAGALAAAAVARTELPALAVSDLLLFDQRGDSVLCLCAQQAGSSGGVPSRVGVLLSGQDFAYAVSEGVLRSAYEVCWPVFVAGVSFVGETSVELPVNNDPNVTQTGTAQLQTSFADTLDDVSITVTTTGHGDAVRLLGTEHVQLLNLWDQDGNQITNLGDLAKPADEPTALPISVFETTGSSPDSINPNFQDLLEKLVAIQPFPTLEPFPAQPDSVTGYCSAAMKTLLVRWTLQTWRSVLVPPTAGATMGGA